MHRSTFYSGQTWREVGVPLLYGLLGLALGVGAGYVVFATPNTVKLVVATLGVALFALSVAKLEWGLILLAVIVYTNVSDVAIKWYGAPSVTKSFGAILLFAIATRWALYGDQPRGWARAGLLMGLYGLVAYSSALYAYDPGRALSGVETLFKNMIIALSVVILLQRVATLRRVIWALLFVGLFLGSLTILQFLTKSYNNVYFGFAQYGTLTMGGGSTAQRASGPVGDPNYYALVMAVLVPFALDRFWNERRWVWRLLALAALLACGGAVILTYSRSGFIVLAVVTALSLLTHTPNLRHLILVAFAALVLLRLAPARYTDRLASLLPDSRHTPLEDQAIRGRWSEFLVAWRMFQEHPVLGVGYDNYPALYQHYSRQIGLDPRTTERSAHNLYMEILAEMGIVGLSVFLFLIGHALRDWFYALQRASWVREPQAAGMIAATGIAVIGYLVGSLFIHDAYQRYFWLLLAMLLATPNVMEHLVEERDQPLRKWT